MVGDLTLPRLAAAVFFGAVEGAGECGKDKLVAFIRDEISEDEKDEIFF